MADTVDVQYIYTSKNRATVKLTCISDGTGETAVSKVDLSTLTGPDGTPPTRTIVETIEASIQGFTSVKLYWDHTTDDELAILGTGYSYFNWIDVGGFLDPTTSDGTGDIILTSTGASATATYDIVLSIKLLD